MSTAVAEGATPERRTIGSGLRSALALMSAGAAVFCLLFGLSYPGFPFSTAVWGLLAAAVAVSLVVASGLRAVTRGRGGVRAAVMLALVALVFAGGVVAAKRDDGARLGERWASSQTAFEAEVATAGSPPPVESSDDGGYFDRYPGPCPARIGDFRVIECRSLDGGYLFLQAQGAITDDSGILYLPGGLAASADWLSGETVVPLGGPWWSWTCYC